MQRVAMRAARIVEPRLLADSDGVHHPIVTFPPGSRISEPGGIGILGMLAAIRENLAERSKAFEQHHHHARRLDDLERVGKRGELGHSGYTLRRRIGSAAGSV